MENRESKTSDAGSGAWPKYEVYLDVLRCVAALLVLLAHWRILLFQDYTVLQSPSTAIRLFYFFSGIGRPAVILFFVLSGYLVTGSALRAWRSNRWTVAGYLNQRVTRLSTVLMPALALCWLWDSIGLHVARGGLYDGVPFTTALIPGVAARHGMGVLIQNACYLQGITSTTYGSDDPLWSLSYEFWYYLFLIPLIYLFARGGFGRRALWLIGLAAGLVFVGQDIRVNFLIWLLGAAVVLAERIRLRTRRVVHRSALVLSAVLLAIALMATRAGRMPGGFAGPFLLALSCAFFIAMASRDRTMQRPNRFVRGARNLAGWSYSLYLLHMPLLVLIASLILPRDRRWYPDAKHLLQAMPVLVLVLAYAYVVSLVTEKKTPQVRRWVGNKARAAWMAMRGVSRERAGAAQER